MVIFISIILEIFILFFSYLFGHVTWQVGEQAFKSPLSCTTGMFRSGLQNPSSAHGKSYIIAYFDYI
jgi:hypothetical protein